MAALLAGILTPHTADASACDPFFSKYERRGDQMWYVGSNGVDKVETQVANADLRTFKPMPNPTSPQCPNSARVEYARDGQTVFFRGQPVRGANPRRFKFIDQTYAQDGTAVYARARQLTTRVADFRIMKASSYATDGLRYFYEDVILEGTNLQFPASSRTRYARTSTHVYLHGKPLDADPESFEVIGGYSDMSKDRHKVFFKDLVVEDADASTFQQLTLPLLEGQACRLLEKSCNESRGHDLVRGHCHAAGERQELRLQPRRGGLQIAAGSARS